MPRQCPSTVSRSEHGPTVYSKAKKDSHNTFGTVSNTTAHLIAMASTSSRGDAKGIGAAPSATIYMAVRFFLTCILKIFFREVETRGAHNIPREGPVLFLCGPHANQVGLG
jgi:hypothetical protein